MNKNELIETLKESNGLSKLEAQKVVELFFESMTDALAKGGRVEVRGLCSFYIKEYKGYTGRNPNRVNVHRQYFELTHCSPVRAAFWTESGGAKC